MRAKLRRSLLAYQGAVQVYAEATGDKIASSMVDCADFLLIESERLGRGAG